MRLRVVLLSLASGLLWGCSDFWGGVISRRAPVLAVTLVSQGVGFVVLLAAFAVLRDVTWSSFRFGLLGWKVMSELPNPINFEAATAHITPDDVQAEFGCGPDADAHVAAAQPFVDAGFDHLALVNAGPDVDGFFAHVADGLAERIRALTPGGAATR